MLDERFASAENAMTTMCERLEARLSAKVGELSDKLDESFDDETFDDETYDETDSFEAVTEREICQLRAGQDRAKRELSELRASLAFEVGHNRALGELRADCAREIRQKCAAHESAKAEAASQVMLNAEAATLSLVAATAQTVVQSMNYTREKFEECKSIALGRCGIGYEDVPPALVERELKRALEGLIGDLDSATPQNGLSCAVPNPRSYFDPRAAPELC
jgi:hypothetical protein